MIAGDGILTRLFAGVTVCWQGRAARFCPPKTRRNKEASVIDFVSDLFVHKAIQHQPAVVFHRLEFQAI